jgi:hypothetical protein
MSFVGVATITAGSRGGLSTRALTNDFKGEMSISRMRRVTIGSWKRLFANGSDVQPGAPKLLKQRYRKRDERDQQRRPG